MIQLLSSRPSLRRPPKPLVNLGCGRRRHPDWTNCDLIPDGPDVMALDVSRPLPFEASSCDAVYAAHVLEHLAIADAHRFVAEIHRVLRPGGIVRLVVPDLEGIARAYLASLDRAATDGTDPSRWEHRWMTIELLDQLVRDTSGGLMRRFWSCDPVPCRDFLAARVGEEAVSGIAAVTAARAAAGEAPLDPRMVFKPEPAQPRVAARLAASGERHRWMYDRVSLATLLEDAGFGEVRPMNALTSRIAGFSSFGLDTDSAGHPRKPDSLYGEGVKL